MSSNQRESYRVVRLLKNRIYPTYQLHAFMANKKTSPKDGLRLAALITMAWVKCRLGNDAPDELANAPAPDKYLKVDDSALPSLHLNNGYVVDIVSTPALGVWSLQITEPDLGSDPGNPEQKRDAVPGRIIETSVEFRATDIQLECGFKTSVSDPAGVKEMAEVYRLAIVKRLANHPAFGLKQVVALTPSLIRIETVDSLKSLGTVYRSDQNHLPIVVFTHSRSKREPAKNDIVEPNEDLALESLMTRHLSVKYDVYPTISEAPPYDMESFAKSGLGYCRTYLLAN